MQTRRLIELQTGRTSPTSLSLTTRTLPIATWKEFHNVVDVYFMCPALTRQVYNNEM